MRALAAVLLLFSTGATAQTIYRWTDKKGEVHYTDDLSAVPKGAKLETTEGEELMVVPAPRPQAPVVVPKQPTRLSVTTRSPPVQSGPIEVRLTQVMVPVSDADRAYIEESIKTAAASPRLTAFGGLRLSVDVEITPAEKMIGYVGSDAFGRAVGLNKMQLRAPRDLHVGSRPLDYSGTALHELAHILEHQLAGQLRPAWFAEGFACVVAEQTRGAIDDIAYWVIHDGGPRPLDTLFSGRCDVHLAYAIAQQAVRYLVTLVGEEGLRDLFEQRAKGSPFEAAFSKVTGLSVDEFQTRFIESLRPSYYERAR